MVMESLPEQVDVAVIGGGVGSYIAAIRAAVEISPSSCIDEVIVNTRVGALSYD